MKKTDTKRPKTVTEFQEAVQTAKPGERIEPPEPEFT
jgi:hypothetical protein